MKNCKLRIDLVNYLKDCIHNGIDDDGKFTYAVEDTIKVLEKICDYVEKSGDIALSCGSEWMYQDDDGQIDGLQCMGRILDCLEQYAEE